MSGTDNAKEEPWVPGADSRKNSKLSEVIGIAILARRVASPQVRTPEWECVPYLILCVRSTC